MTLIKNALVVDGSGDVPFAADILLEGDSIARIGPGLSVASDARVIDASGLAAAPGFIDAHGHNDLRVLETPEVLPKLMQGITTEVIGQDGISMAPLPLDRIGEWRAYLSEFNGTSESLPLDYVDTAGYLDRLEAARPSANYCYLLPHGNVRLEAMGLENRAPTASELKAMRNIVRREMEAGCFGLSTGLIYAPCSYAATDELAALCEEVAAFDGMLMIHQRSEADAILDSMREVLEIGRRSGVRLHFSHFKVCGKKNAPKLDAMFELLDRAREEGLDVSLDQYPYVAGSTSLGVALPPWAHDGGVEELARRLSSKAERARMAADIERGIPGWDNFIDFAGFDGIFLTSAVTDANKRFLGKSMDEIAALTGKEPLDVVLDLVLEERNRAGMVDFYGTEDAVVRIMGRPEMCVSSDAVLDEMPHPRAYGAFPRVLGKYARDEKALPLEAAVRKMSGKTAEVLRLERRGLLREGFYADLVLFDPNTVADTATYVDPKRFPSGIRWVLVNGEAAVAEGRYAGGRSGAVLKRK